MKLLDSLKHLFAESTLFQEKGRTNPVAQKNTKSGKRGPVKIGQGGTLDPLADGVLGEVASSPLPLDVTRILIWTWRGLFP